MTRKYKVRFGKRAQESLKKIDKSSSRIIMAWIKELASVKTHIIMENH